MELREKLAKIQNELKVKKSRYNKFGKYNYRAAEDILEALKPFELKYECTFTIDEECIDNMVLKSTAKITNWKTSLEDQADDYVGGGNKNAIHASAIVGVEKAGGMALPQAYGAASSYGKKYALGNLLLIDDTQDADASNNHTHESKPRRVGFGADAKASSGGTDLGF